MPLRRIISANNSRVAFKIEAEVFSSQVVAPRIPRHGMVLFSTKGDFDQLLPTIVKKKTGNGNPVSRLIGSTRHLFRQQ
jgi:hypothetical protein